MTTLGIAAGSLDALSVLNAMPGSYLILLPDAPRFTIIGASDAYLDNTHLQREKILGEPIFETLTDDPANPEATGVKNLTASLLYVVEHKQPHRMNDQRYDVFNPQTGVFERRVWRPLNKPVLDGSGAIQYIIHAVEDVTETTELQRKNELLRKFNDNQRALLHNLFIQMPVAIAIVRGPRYLITLANNAYLRIIGRNRAQALHKPFFKAVPEAADQGYEALLQTVLTTGQPVYVHEKKLALIRGGQTEIAYFNFVYQPLREMDASVSGVIVLAHEVTELVKARRDAQASEQELQKRVAERTRELQRSNDELQQFAHVASHDLKEPVRKIRVFSSLLETEYGKSLSESAKQYVDRIDRAAARMSQMIDGVLLYSSINAITQPPTPVDLNSILTHIQDDLEVPIKEKQATIVAEPLPVISGWSILLYQLFYNLINNALKFTRNGTAPRIFITSTITPSPTGLAAPSLVITVSDNGIGFEQSAAEVIFDSFVRLNSKDLFEGTGLGLSLCRNIVERHGGYISACGKEGAGATFKIVLPMREG